MTKQSQIDQAILGGGGFGAPIVHGDFRLYEVSIHSPSNLGAPLELIEDTIFQERGNLAGKLGLD